MISTVTKGEAKKLHAALNVTFFAIGISREI